MAKFRTHYDNLKVSRNAPQEVIKAAYRVLSQKYHPDLNQNDSKANDIMQLINEAYAILSDPQKREEHDKWIDKQERVGKDLDDSSIQRTTREEYFTKSYEPQPTTQHTTQTHSELAESNEDNWVKGVILLLVLGLLLWLFVFNKTEDRPTNYVDKNSLTNNELCSGLIQQDTFLREY